MLLILLILILFNNTDKNTTAQVLILLPLLLIHDNTTLLLRWRGGQVRCTLKPSVAGSGREVGFCHVTLTTHAWPSPRLARNLARCRPPRLPSLPRGCGCGCGCGCVCVWCGAHVLLQDGWTPVHIAAQNGHTAALNVLIRAGGDVKAALPVSREGRGRGRVEGWGDEMRMRAWREGGVGRAREGGAGKGMKGR